MAQYKNEIKMTEERASTIFFGYVEHMDVLRLRQEKELKIEQLEKREVELKADKEKMFKLVKEVMACHSPTPCYALFLHENFPLFYMESLKNEVSYEMEDFVQFLWILRSHDVPTQHLMCELYFYGCLLYLEKDFNPIPYVGDIHSRAFTSYDFNQIHWQKASNTFESN